MSARPSCAHVNAVTSIKLFHLMSFKLLSLFCHEAHVCNPGVSIELRHPKYKFLLINNTCYILSTLVVYRKEWSQRDICRLKSNLSLILQHPRKYTDQPENLIQRDPLNIGNTWSKECRMKTMPLFARIAIRSSLGGETIRINSSSSHNLNS